MLAVALLGVGTVVARGAQDPDVALPRGVVAVNRMVPTPQASRTDGQQSVALQPAAQSSETTDPDTKTQGIGATDMPMGEAEEGAPEPTAAPGTTLSPVQASAGGTPHPVAIPAQTWGTEGRAVRLSIEIENGLAIDEAEFASTVAGILSDSRGWQRADGVHFVPMTPDHVKAGASVDVRVTLATPTLTAKLCGPLRVSPANVSCWWGGRAVINLHRWLRGATTYGGELAAYRTYLINHEVGHGLGHRHVSCPGPGREAPIMVQQTLSLEGCRAWPWPTKG